MTNQESPRVRALALRAVWLLPLGLWAFGMYQTWAFAVNVPYWDSWEITEVVVGQRPLTLQTLWRQHNEHRIVLQLLYEVAWARLTGWDQFLGAFLPYLVVGAAFLLFVYRAAATRPELTPVQRALLVAALSLLLFNLRQHELLIWSFLVTWGAVAALFVLFADVFARSDGGRRYAAALGAIALAATLSTAQGLSLFAFMPAMVVLGLVVRRRPPTGLAILAVLAAAVIPLYFVGYSKPGHHPPVTFALTHPGDAISYLCVLLGSPYAARVGWAQPVGAAILATCVAALVAALRKWGLDGLWRVACRYPLVPIGGLTLLVITLGRVGIGVQQATASRYVPFSAIFVASVVLLGVDLFGERSTRLRTAALALLVVASVPAWYLGYRDSLVELEFRHEFLTTYRDCVLERGIEDSSCDGGYVAERVEILPARAEMLRSLDLCFFGETRAEGTPLTASGAQ